MNRQTVCLALCLAGFALGVPASKLHAQAEGAAAPGDTTEDDDAPALWEFRIAAFGRYAPVYPAADESDLTVLPLPIPVYRGSFLSFGENLDQVARGDIVDTPRIRLGIDLDFTFGEKSADIAVRRGMPDLDFMAEIGPELEIRLSDRPAEQGQFFLALQLRAGVSLDGLSPSSRGYLFNPEFEYRRDQAFGGDNLLSLRLKPTWASEDFMDYYYEVEPAFATLSRPAFDATSGYLGSQFTAALTRQINDKLVLGVSASYYLHSGAENKLSPLFRSRSGASIQAALVWTLAESEKRATPRPSR
jgi:outer membrane scaffolding protein for murein synthesis (MipA/OmpV family)